METLRPPGSERRFLDGRPHLRLERGVRLDKARFQRRCWRFKLLFDDAINGLDKFGIKVQFFGQLLGFFLEVNTRYVGAVSVHERREETLAVSEFCLVHRGRPLRNQDGVGYWCRTMIWWVILWLLMRYNRLEAWNKANNGRGGIDLWLVGWCPVGDALNNL